MDYKTVAADIHHSQRVVQNQVPGTRNDDDSKGSANAPTAVARYAYEKFGYSVEKGEKLIVLNKTNQDWWEVRNVSGEVGYVPAIYISDIRTIDTAKVVKLHPKKSIGKADADKMEHLPRPKQNNTLPKVQKPANVHNEALSNENAMNQNMTKQEPIFRRNFKAHNPDSTDGKENDVSLRKKVPNIQKSITRTNSERERMYRVKSLPDSQWPKDNFDFKSYVTGRTTSLQRNPIVSLSDQPKLSGSLGALSYPQSKTLSEASLSQEHIPANITDWTIKKKLEPKLYQGDSEQRPKMARTLGHKSPGEKHASLWQRSFPVIKSKTNKQESGVVSYRAVNTAPQMKKSEAQEDKESGVVSYRAVNTAPQMKKSEAQQDKESGVVSYRAVNTAPQMKKSEVQQYKDSGVVSYRVVNTATEMKKSELKEQYITEALKADKGRGASLVTWSSESLSGKGDIMSCKVETVNITYTQNGREESVSYVAKINPHNNIPGFEEITNSLIKREAVFYSEIAPKLNSAMKNNEREELRIPRCLYVNIEESPEVIILEDLFAAGYKKANKKQGLSLNETKLVITELARFHAASIILDNEVDLGRRYPGLTPNSVTEKNKEEQTILENILKTGILLLNQLGGYDGAVRWLTDAMPRVQNMLRSCMNSCGVMKVLCHGDCLVDNICFRYDKEGMPVDVKFINFQACVLGSPALDLNYLLFSSLNGSNRIPNIEAYLSLYTRVLHQVLSTSEEDQISFNHELIKKEYRSKNPYGILIGLSSVAAMVSEERDIPVVLGSDQGVEATMSMFAVEWQARQAILLKRNPALSPRLAAIADDIINYTMAPIESSM